MIKAHKQINKHADQKKKRKRLEKKIQVIRHLYWFSFFQIVIL